MSNISVDDLSAAIGNNLEYYNAKITENIKQETDNIAKELKQEIAQTAPKKTGRYIRAMKIRTATENNMLKVKQWYVSAPEYRKTHLLEYGHKTRTGGKSKAYPHIEPAATKLLDKFIQRVKDIVNNG